MGSGTSNLAALIPSVFVGSKGERLTPEQIAQRQLVAQALAERATDTRPDAGGWASVLSKGLQGFQSGRDERASREAGKLNADENKALVASLLGGLGAPQTGMASPVSGENAPVSTTGASGTDVGQFRDTNNNNGVFDAFMNTVRSGGVQNPYALAAIAATGQRESSFAPQNVNRTWNDPSESGQAGRAGGVMSWRGPRYAALAATGDLSPEGQAKFFLQEDPKLIQALNGAQSLEEAQSLMNNAWRFAGYNREGGESAARINAARGFLPRFQGGGAEPAASQAASPVMQGQGMPASTGINPAVVAALASPYADPNTRGVAQALLGNQMSQQQAAQQQQMQRDNFLFQQQYQQEQQQNDPMRQAQIAHTQAQTQKLQQQIASPSSDESFFGNPVAIQNSDGTIAYGQIGNRGSFKPIQLGEGQTFAPPTRTMDTGTEIVLTDQAGNVISRTPKENREAAAQTASGTVEGRTQAEKVAAAPAALQEGMNALSILDQIEKHPGIDLGTGVTSIGNRIPGSPGYDFQNIVKQAQSGAFLSAIDNLRGLGALSNAEGQTATAAITRMDAATSKDAFLKALSDYRKIVQQGIDRSQALIGVSGASQASAPNAGSAQSEDIVRAKAAIAKGANREAVIKRLRDAGIPTEGL